VSFFLGYWLGGKIDMWWMGIVLMMIVSPLSFIRMMKALERLESSDD